MVVDTSSEDLPLRVKRKFISPQHELIELCISNFCPSRRYKLLLSEDVEEKAAARKTDLLWGCGQAILGLLHRQSEAIRLRNSENQLVITRCSDMIEIAHEKFYSFAFNAVPRCWTELYREASLLKFTALAMTGVWAQDGEKFENVPPLTERQLDDMVRTIDMAIIMTGPPPAEADRANLDTAMGLLGECHLDSLIDSAHAAKRQNLSVYQKCCHGRFPSISAAEPHKEPANIISKVPELSFGAFEKHMRAPLDPDIGPEPIVIDGLLKDWYATADKAWRSPEYLMAKTIGGRRLVPIETGKSYVDESFGQKIVSFKDFLEQYVLEPQDSRGVGYLAQYNLFVQIPSLRDDITIPDYCYTSPPGPHPSSPFAEAHKKTPRLEEPLLSAWFGPAGTITPLHTDPYHNILAQVVGKKYVRLYPPRESNNMYAKMVEDGIDMSNTSEVDVGILAGLDGTPEEIEAAEEKFPLFKKAHYVECVLNEGECLYIPIGWWHYVRSLSVSFSVSFWFN